MEPRERKRFTGKLFCGRSNVLLAEAVGEELAQFTTYEQPNGAGWAPCVARFFNDREPRIEFPDNLRGSEIFLIQSLHQPGSHFVELLAMLDAAARADAQDVTVVVPYFGYARQDRKVKPRTPITAAMASNLIYYMGAKRILTTDLHAGQIQGFTPYPPRPFPNLEALPVLLRKVAKDLGVTKRTQFSEFAFVSPDDGGYARVRETGKLVNCSHATLFKKGRDREGRIVRGGFILDPALVRGRACLLIDDLVATAGSLELSAQALREAGAPHIAVVVVHPVLSTDPETGMSAYERLAHAPIDRCYFGDTIPFSETRAVWVNTPQEPDDRHDPERARRFFRELEQRVTVVSTAGLFAGAINEIHQHGSVSGIFERTCREIFADGDDSLLDA